MDTKTGLILLLLMTAPLQAETINTTVSTDGTRFYQTHVYEPGDKDFERVTQSISEFDSEKKLLSIEQIYSDSFSAQTQIAKQKQIYGPDGKILNYVIVFTPQKSADSGVDQIIEYTDDKDQTIRIEYYKNQAFLFAERNIDLLNRFPFYRIDFVHKVMFEDFKDRPGATDFGVSAKYVSGRSIVKFVGTPVDMDEDDIKFLTFYFKSRNAEKMLPLYTKKIAVEEDGNKHFVLMQDSLLPYIKDQNWGAITYYIGVIDQRLELISVGFVDVDFKKNKP